MKTIHLYEMPMRNYLALYKPDTEHEYHFRATEFSDFEGWLNVNIVLHLLEGTAPSKQAQAGLSRCTNCKYTYQFHDNHSR